MYIMNYLFFEAALMYTPDQTPHQWYHEPFHHCLNIFSTSVFYFVNYYFVSKNI